MAMPTEVQPKRTTKRAWHTSLVPSDDAAMLLGAVGATFPCQQFVWPAVLVLCGAAALTVDIPVARWFRIAGLPGDLNKLVQLAEVFGHGFSTAIIFLAVWMLAPQLRSRLPRAIGIAYCGGLGAILVKELVRAAPAHDWTATGHAGTEHVPKMVSRLFGGRRAAKLSFRSYSPGHRIGSEFDLAVAARAMAVYCIGGFGRNTTGG